MKNLVERDQKVIWHPFTPLITEAPIPIASAQGVYLHTESGEKILDAISSWWVNIHGHAHPYIAQKIAEQARTLEHVIFAGFTHVPAVTLAERLLTILPNQSKIFYSDNGSTAVEVALKMAFQYWHNQGVQKTKVIAFKGAYHGDTFGAMSVGGRSSFTAPFAPLLFDVEAIDLPTSQNEQEVLDRFEELATQKNVAAFIYEPLIQGVSGMRTYTPDALKKLLKIAKAYDVLCIADEVMTGFGRTGKMFASNYVDVLPDIIALSKGLTGGTLALGVTTCTSKVVKAFESADALKTFFHGHSFTANPIACATANASLDLFLDDVCQTNIQRISIQHEAFFKKIQNHIKVKEVRHLGTILAIEVVTPEETSYFNSLRTSVSGFFMERGILIRPLGNVLYIMPPYIIKNEELSNIYDAIYDFLEKIV